MAPEIDIPLEERDIKLLESKAKFRKTIGLGLAALFLIAGSILFFAVDQMIGICVLILSGPSYFILNASSKKIKAEISTGKKIRITGLPEQLTISKPGETISWKKVSAEHIELSIQTPGGRKEILEPIELAPGQKDEYFYTLKINGREITLNRRSFFTLDLEKEITVEVLPGNELIRIKND